jgi:NADH:ubiquinone oxidoreductase subunit 3 (subunit A)
MEEDYESTVVWAEQEEQNRLTRGQSVSNFYLFGMSLLILILCVLVLYFWNRSDKEISALNLVQDPANRLIEDFTQSEFEVDEAAE